MGRIVKPIIVPERYFELLKEYMARNRQLIEDFKSGKTSDNKRILLVVRCADGILNMVDCRSNGWDETIGTNYYYKPDIEFEGFDSDDAEIRYKLNLLEGLIISGGRCRVSDLDPLIQSYYGNHSRICYNAEKIPDDIRKIISDLVDELYSAYISDTANEEDFNRAASIMELICFIDNRFSYNYLKPLSLAERFNDFIRKKDFDNLFAILCSVKLWGTVKVIYSQTGERLYPEALHEKLLDIKPDWSGIEMLNN